MFILRPGLCITSLHIKSRHWAVTCCFFQTAKCCMLFFFLNSVSDTCFSHSLYDEQLTRLIHQKRKRPVSRGLEKSFFARHTFRRPHPCVIYLGYVPTIYSRCMKNHTQCLTNYLWKNLFTHWPINFRWLGVLGKNLFLRDR